MVLCHLSRAFVQVSSVAIAQRHHMLGTLQFSDDRKQAYGRAAHKLPPCGVAMLTVGPRHLLQDLLGDTLLPHICQEAVPWHQEPQVGD